MANYFSSPANRTKSVASYWPAELGQAVGFAVDRVDRRLGEAPGRRTARGGSTSWDRPTRGLLKNPQAACVAAKVVAPLGKAWTPAVKARAAWKAGRRGRCIGIEGGDPTPEVEIHLARLISRVRCVDTNGQASRCFPFDYFDRSTQTNSSSLRANIFLFAKAGMLQTTVRRLTLWFGLITLARSISS